MENLDEKKKKNNIQKSLDMLAQSKSGENRLPPIPPGSAMKDKDARKEKKRGDRGLKYKKKYDKDSE